MENNSEIKKKKVLFLLEAFDKGGIEQVTLDIVNHLNPEKYVITIQTFWYGGYCQSLVNDNVKVKPFFFKRYIKGVIRLIEYLPPQMLYTLFVHGDYDVEIAASDGGAAKVIAGSNNKKAKKICWVHMDVIDQGSKLREYKSMESAEKIYNKFDKIICVSDYVKRNFIKKFGFEKITETVHNPIPVEEIQRKAEEKIEVGYNPNQFNVVAVGSLMQVKGFDRLIRVCGNLKKYGNLSITLTIIGSGPMEDELNKIIENNEFDNIRLIGFKSNPYPFIRYADLLVCSSYSEAFPTVIGESFALGTPVMGTRCSGVCEWLEKDKSGILVENDEQALYEGIKSVLANKEKLKKYKLLAEEKGEELDYTKSLRTWEKTLI